ncbi:SCO family protein [Jiella avicenniae]|uniref:SCO family protein n=1 Tax=Jiella avicenniae TaxID=2907202 RepID=A0A9X1P006_9HYPH|nr:SCO family protein [Jiella avicenniae]MCE7027998.1 SCO family protein [Jiella avicenniae]
MTCRLRKVSALIAAVALSGFACAPAVAGLTRDELSSVGFFPVSGAALPLDARLSDATGEIRTLGARLGGRPGLVAFVDFTCTTICGVAANVLAGSERALTDGGGLDHRTLVVGFDARDTAADRDAWLARNAEAATLGRSAIVTADPATTARVVESAGLRTVYDAEHDQFAHPAGALLVDTKGRILRTLDLVSLEPDTLRSALIEASDGTAGSFVERAILSCYGWDAETGRYKPLIDKILMIGCSGTAAAAAGFVGFMLLRERRREAGRPQRPVPGGRHG